MNTIQIIEKSGEELDSRFTDQFWNATQGHNNTRNNEIEKHINTLLTNIAKSEIERLEGEKKSIEDFTLSDNFPQTMSENVYAQGYNTAIQDQITYWQQVLKDITK